MTFKTNVPDRWIENPDQLPFKSFHKLDSDDKKKKSVNDGGDIFKSLTQGAADLAASRGSIRNSVTKVNNHCASATISNATFNAASKTRENFRSFGNSGDDELAVGSSTNKSVH